MQVLIANEMRLLDAMAADEYGMPGVVLMEGAGIALANAVESLYGPLSGKRIAICCGGGNNGGDGWAAARHLALRGARPEVLSLAAPGRMKGDAAIHAQAYAALRLPYKDSVEAGQLPELLQGFSLIVECLLGTGFKAPLRDEMLRAIDALNGSGIPILSADIPAGVHSDTGHVAGNAVHAAQTVTFAYPKPGLFLPPGDSCAGGLLIDPIGYLWDNLKHESTIALTSLWDARGELLVWARTAKTLLQKRRSNTNKSDYGHVFVIGGSRGMAGAPTLSALAAQRAGAGLVTVMTAESVQGQIAAKCLEQMTVPLPEKAGCISKDALLLVKEKLQNATLACIGPGLGEGAGEFVQELLSSLPCSLVLDADGLNALASNPSCLNLGAHTLVITPHPGEAARLLGCTISEIEEDRIGSACKLASRYGAIAVLKGSRTIIADPTGRVRVNGTGNAGMATGGSGDVLTGIVGALVARALTMRKKQGDTTVDMLDVVALAVCIHGLAGDLHASKHGEAGLIASDIIDELPQAHKKLEGLI